MKNLKFIGVILLLTFSCDDVKNLFPDITFESSFPKSNRKLTRVLGEQFTLKNGEDTVAYKVISSGEINLIQELESGDTIFMGKVCKYRGLYYFNHYINDTSYHIFAVKIQGNLIYGFNKNWEQLLWMHKALKAGDYATLVKYKNADSTVFKLKSEKKGMRKLFTYVLDNIKPDTILNSMESNENLTLEEEDIDDFHFFSKVYPNPSADFINIELENKGKATYELYNLEGKMLLNGELNENETVDLKSIPTGVYTLTVINDQNQKETIKLVKK